MTVSSIQRTAASGSTDTFSVPFGYLDKTHVQIRVAGVLKTVGVDYTWTTASTIQLTAGNPAAGTIVERRRVTPGDPLTTFTPGNLDTGDLNVAELQTLYVAQEAEDNVLDLQGQAWIAPSVTPGLPGVGGTIAKGVEGNIPEWNADGNLVDSGASASSVGDSEAAAAASAAAADASASAASASATAAAGSASAAAASAAQVGQAIATRAALKALDTAAIKLAYLTEAGREGTFVWKTGDYSAQIAADAQEGIFIKANAVAATAGAWVRVYSRLNVEFFGASASASRADNTTAIQAAVNVAQLYVGELFLPATYLTSAPILVSSNLRLCGVSAFTSGISSNSGAAITLVPDTGIANNNTWYGFFNFSAISTDAGAHFGIEYTATGSEYLSNWVMEGVYASGTSGAASFDSTGSTVGIFSCTLRRNWFANGLVIKDGGDSITILENTINGNGIGIFVNALKTGARQLVIRNNNITTRSECVYLLNVTGAIIDSNWMETPSYLGSYTGTTTALLYAQSCPNTRIMRNTIQPLASVGGGFVPAAYSIRLNTTGAASSIVDNDIAIGGTGHIQIGAGVSNTLIHWDNKFDVTPVITDAGTGTWGSGNTPGVFNQLAKFTTTAQFTSTVLAESTNTGTGNGPYYEVYRNKAGGAAVSDGLGGFLWYMNNSVGTKTNLGYITMTVLDPVSGTEDGQFNLARMVAGSLVVALTLGNTFAFSTGGSFVGNITPGANDGGALGTTALQWSDLFLASGAVINFANGNYTITHSTGTLTLSGILVASQYNVGGNQVVGARQTGWTAGTGTANKGAFAAYAGQTHTASYVQATIQALDNAARDASQRVKAIEDALRAHGLIN
ncbi:MAG: hypothetical protein EOQ93_29300 [Mesorhizobium sp.]|nr:MAG: hypothetical protein EOQ93_29300 [Mesorhizobium sp.]